MSIRSPSPTPSQKEHIDRIKLQFEALELILLGFPNNRERALALTNLEQASMWATKAVLQG